MVFGKWLWRWMLAGALGVTMWSALAISPEALDALEGKVDELLQQTVDELLEPTAFYAQSLGLPYPVPAPTKGIDDLNAELSERVRAEALKAFPEAQREVFLAEAKQKFSVYKRGDLVRVEAKDGNVFEGRLRETSEFAVTIDLQRVRFDEMTEESLARFKPDLSATRIGRYTNQHMQEWHLKRDQHEKQIRDAMERELFTAAGYVEVLDKWIPLADYAANEWQDRRDELATRLRPLLQVQVYYDAGYRYFQGVWMTEAEMKQRIQVERLKNEFPPDFEVVMKLLNEENAKTVVQPGAMPPGGGNLDIYK
jgi:hypothetical protein